MARIERRAALPASAGGRAVAGEAGRGLPGQLPAGVMLGDEFHVAVGGSSVLGLVLDPEVRELEVPVDDGQVVGRGKRQAGLRGGIGIAVGGRYKLSVERESPRGYATGGWFQPRFMSNAPGGRGHTRRIKHYGGEEC